jgi:hypothetical protein
MNKREGIKRILITVILAIEVALAATMIWIALYEPAAQDSATSELIAIWAVNALGLPLVVCIGWVTANWIARGFQNSN